MIACFSEKGKAAELGEALHHSSCDGVTDSHVRQIVGSVDAQECELV